MSVSPKTRTRTARCACGSVELEAVGAPIASVVCYCDDCQSGSRQIEALPDAGPVLDADGGTDYASFRTDRITYVRGASLLRPKKLKPESATNRMVASCCNSAMVMTFDDTRHWAPIYRARFQDDAPPLQWRICTRFRPEGGPIPDDVPASASYPFGMIARLLGSSVAMMLGR